MQITHAATGIKHTIVIESVTNKDYKSIIKARYFFNWKTEKENKVYKLCLKNSEEILGLISLLHVEDEQRFEINLLAVSKENRGKDKLYEGIGGNLIAYACRVVLKLYGAEGAVSLIPKTRLREHYIKKYGMLDAGWHLLLQGKNLIQVIQNYNTNEKTGK